MKTLLRRLLVLFVLACVGTLIHLRSTRVPVTYHVRSVRRSVVQRKPAEPAGPAGPTGLTGPANSTLGFGAVLAVSRTGSKRQERLLYAANLTDIDITIPTQPAWTDEDVEQIRSKSTSKISRGSALAWLGHLHSLRWFLNSNHETAVIIEDDVDWDIHLRSSQVPAVSAAFRTLVSSQSTPFLRPSTNTAQVPLKSNSSSSGYISDSDPSNDYWGPPSKWEILYLGHCGDYFPAHRFRNNLAHKMFVDKTLPPIPRMHEKTQKFWKDLKLPNQQRIVHRSVWPLCTFAYAVNRRSARRILAEFDREGKDGTPAYDVRILEACRDLGWLCYSVNPELFHHDDGPSEIAAIDEEESGQAGGVKGSGAPNIACGARSEELFTKDPDTLRYLRTHISSKGECLIDQMQQSMGEWP